PAPANFVHKAAISRQRTRRSVGRMDDTQYSQLSGAIADLAGAVGAGFVRVEGRLDRIEFRLDRAEDRLARLEVRVIDGFASLDTRVAKLEKPRRR
ncbi:MAG TPA: hypothetical protein VMV65_01400, partial [Alphaproteobacteria bacterium]|nr:hypothetical protein [Alphaproteobacteria bacterium]